MKAKIAITINKAWAAEDDKHPEQDIILPEGTTDWLVVDYDGRESLYYVKDGKLYDEDNERVGGTVV